VVWTTTPWTLVSNTALAVNPALAYVELRKKGGGEWSIVLAEARAAGVLGADWADRWDVVATLPGTALVGRRYRRPLDWVAYPADGPLAGAHEVIVGEEFVSAEDGSGVVHMAPAFGADDYAPGGATGWRSCSRWTRAGASTRRSRWSAASSSSAPTRRSSTS
jgi:isoleucyl-tRNA synthetase